MFSLVAASLSGEADLLSSGFAAPLGRGAELQCRASSVGSFPGAAGRKEEGIPEGDGEVQASDVVQEADEGEAKRADGPFDGINSWFLSQSGKETVSLTYGTVVPSLSLHLVNFYLHFQSFSTFETHI